MKVKSKQFITDEKGRKKAVILSYREYQKLIDYIQDLEDAIELDQLSQTDQNFHDYTLFQKELKKKGHLK